MALKQRIRVGLPLGLWGYENVQVDTFLERALTAVLALERDRPEFVIVTTDLMGRPEFRLRWNGYKRLTARPEVTDFAESVIGHTLLHSAH